MKEMTQGDPKTIKEALREFYDAYDAESKVSDDFIDALAKSYTGKESQLWRELYDAYDKEAGVSDEYIGQMVSSYPNPYAQAEKKKEQTPSSGGGVPSPSGGTASPKVTENVLGLSYGTPSPVAQVSPVQPKPKIPPAGPALKPKPPVVEQPEEKPGRVKSALSDVMMGVEEVAAGSLKGLAIAWERGDVSKDEIFEEFKKKRGAEFEGQDEKAKQAFYEVLFTANEEAKKDGRNPAGIPFSGGMVNRKQWGERIPVSAYPELAKYDKTGVLKDVVNIYNEKLMKGIEENPLYKYAEKDIKMMQERYPTNPEFREDFFTSKLPRGFGSLIGFAGAGAASSAVMIPPWIAPALLGSMSNASSEFDAALKKTGDPQKALEAFDSGKFVGMLEGVPFTKPFGSLFGKLSKGFKSAIAKGGLQAVANGTEEGLQEFITDVFNNSNAQEIYDATRELISKETWESGAIGFLTGLVLGGISAKRSTATPEEAKILDKAEAEIKAKGAEVMRERADELAKKKNPTEAEVREAEEIGKVMGQEAQGMEEIAQEEAAPVEQIVAEEQPALPDEEGITPSTEVTTEVAPEAPATPEAQPTEPGTETTPAEPVAPVVPTERITAETPLEEIELTGEDVQEMVRGGEVSAMQAGMALEALETGDETMLPIIEGFKEKKRRKYAIQEQTADEGVLREEGQELGLQGVEQGNTEQKGVAEQGVVPEAQGQEEVGSVDSGGDVYYHGTGESFTDFLSEGEFQSATGNPTSVWGTFFTRDKGEANRYVRDFHGGKGKVVGANLELKKPYEMDYSEFNSFTTPKDLSNPKWDEMRQKALDFKKQLQDEGYDGIVIARGKKAEETVVFDKAQIKSKRAEQVVVPDEKKAEPVTPKRRITSKKPTLKPKKELIPVKQYKKGDGGTKGVFVGEDGTLYKSAVPMQFKQTGQRIDRVAVEGGKTDEYEILKELQENKHVPKVGKLAETSEGLAFEIERLDEIGELTREEVAEVKRILDELNDSGYHVGDVITVMRRPSTRELVIVDFSSGYKGERQSRDSKDYMGAVLGKLPGAERALYDHEQEVETQAKFGEFMKPSVKGYQYAMKMRPFTIGAYPTRAFGKHVKSGEKKKDGYWDIIEYAKPLTADEIRSYELEYIGKGDGDYSIQDEIDKKKKEDGEDTGQDRGVEELPAVRGEAGGVEGGVEEREAVGGEEAEVKGRPRKKQWMHPRETSEQASVRLAEYIEASDYEGRETTTRIDKNGESVDVTLRKDNGKWNWYYPKSKKPFASFDTAKDAVAFIQKQPFWDNGELNPNGRDDAYFAKVKADHVKTELDNGNVLEDINKGNISAEEAIKIIEESGLEVPADIRKMSVAPVAEPAKPKVGKKATPKKKEPVTEVVVGAHPVNERFGIKKPSDLSGGDSALWGYRYSEEELDGLPNNDIDKIWGARVYGFSSTKTDKTNRGERIKAIVKQQDEHPVVVKDNTTRKGWHEMSEDVYSTLKEVGSEDNLVHIYYEKPLANIGGMRDESAPYALNGYGDEIPQGLSDAVGKLNKKQQEVFALYFGVIAGQYGYSGSQVKYTTKEQVQELTDIAERLLSLKTEEQYNNEYENMPYDRRGYKWLGGYQHQVSNALEQIAKGEYYHPNERATSPSALIAKKATPKKKDAVVTEDEKKKKNTAQERPEQPEAPETKPEPKAGDVYQTKIPNGPAVEYRYTDEGWKFKDSRGNWQKETPQTQQKLTEEWGKTQVPKSEQKKLADKIRGLKADLGGGKLNMNIPGALWNTALDMIADSILAGEAVAKAIQKAIDYIGKQVKDFDADAFRLHVVDAMGLESERVVEVRNEKGELLAPNGKPTKLNDEQWRLVRTPAFKAWFGDWENDPENASKVVDENGEPLVVYHGTEKEFTEFDTKRGATRRSKQQIDFGSHFTVSDEYALVYSPKKKKVIPAFLNIREPLDTGRIEYRGDVGFDKLRMLASLMKLPIHPEYYRTKEGEKKDEVQVAFVGLFNIDSKPSAKANELIQSAGYDGIIYDPYHPVGFNQAIWQPKSFVAFSPTQIKLADGSNRTFEQASPDIKEEATLKERLAKAKEEFWQLGKESIKPGMGIDPWKAFEMTAKAFEIGALLVEKGIADFATFVKALRKQFPDNLDWVEANAEKLWNAPAPRFVDAQKRSLAELAKVVGQDVPEGAEREGGKPRVSKVFKNLDRMDLPESVKREIRAKGGEYIPRGLEMTEEDAKLLIEDLGEQWARTQVMSDDSKVMGATRTALISALIDIDNKKIAELEKAGNSAGLLMAELAQADLFARARAIATRAGQEVNSFKLLYKFPADRIAQVAVAERRQAQRDAVESNRQSYDATVDEAYRIAQEAADKAVNEVTTRFEKMLAERDAEIERLSKQGKPARKQKAEKAIAKIQSWIDAIDKSNPDGAVYDITSLLAVGAKEAVKLGLKSVQQSIRIGASVADAIDAGVKAMRNAGHDIDETLFRAKMGEILKDYDPASDKDVRKGMRDLVEAPKEGETTEEKKKRVAKATKKIRDAVKKAYGQEADGRTLTEVLIDDLGMDGDLAQIFATQIQKQFAKEVEVAKAQMDRAKDRAKGIRSGALDKMLDRMTQVDAGTMIEAEAVTAFAEDMGVAGFTPRQQALIRTLSNSVKAANERLMAAQQAMAQPATASNQKQFNQAMAQYNAAQRQVIQLTQQLANVVADRPGWGDMVKMILQGTLLTPRSVGINIFANALQQTTIRMPIQLVSSGLAYIMHKAAGLPRLGSIQAGNAGYWMGAKPGLIEGLENAMKGTSDAAFVTGEAQPVMQPYEAWRRAIQGMKDKDWKALSDINNRAKDFVEMTYGVPMDFMFRLLEVGDRPFQRAAEMAQAMRIADEKGLYKTPKQVQKMTPAERSQHFADLGKFLSDPDPASQKRITEAGLRATFKKGDVLASALLKIAQVGQKSDKIPTVVKQVAGQIAKALFSPIAPYINIPANLLEWQIKLQMWYLAGLKSLHHAEKFRKTRDNAELEKAYNELSIMIIGGALRGVAALLAAYVAPSSDDPEEMDEKIAGYSSQPAGTFNWSAYMRGDNSSYRPGDIYFTTQKLGLLGNMLQARADFKQDIARNPGDDFFPMDEVYQAMGVSKAFVNNSFMRNVQSALTGLQRGDLSRSFLTEYMNTLMTITVPGGNTTSQFALSARKDRVSKPGLKELPWSQRLGALWRDKFQPNPDDLPKIIGLDGKPVAQNESDKYAVNLLNNMFDFLGIKKVTDDPYAYKLVKFFKESGNNKDVLPPSVAREDKNKVTGRRELKYTSKGKEAVIEITPKMHEQLEASVMQARWNLWQALSDSDNWDNMNTEKRVEKLKKIWKEGREAGEKVWRKSKGIPLPPKKKK